MEYIRFELYNPGMPNPCSTTKSVTLKSKEYSRVRRVIISLLVLMERIWIFHIAAPFFSILSALGAEMWILGLPGLQLDLRIVLGLVS